MAMETPAVAPFQGDTFLRPLIPIASALTAGILAGGAWPGFFIATLAIAGVLALFLAGYAWHRRRVLEVKPGITGLWQVNGRSTVSFEERVRLEALYSQKISLMLDLLIILKTPIAVLKAKGAS